MRDFFGTQQSLDIMDDSMNVVSTTETIVIPYVSHSDTHTLSLLSLCLLTCIISTNTATALLPDPTALDQVKEAIELDPINSNTCMIAILRLIDRMKSMFGKEYTPDAMPKWMAELHAIMTNNGMHQPIRLVPWCIAMRVVVC
jgi:hypothetical protein